MRWIFTDVLQERKLYHFYQFVSSEAVYFTVQFVNSVLQVKTINIHNEYLWSSTDERLETLVFKCLACANVPQTHSAHIVLLSRANMITVCQEEDNYVVINPHDCKRCRDVFRMIW